VRKKVSYPFAPVPPRRQASFGDLPLAPKAMSLCFFRTFRVGAFGLLGRPPHSHMQSSASQRLPATRSQSSLRDRKLFSCVETEGSAIEAADTGACRFDLTTGPLAAAEDALPEADS